jgi:hypothetical protein
MGVQRFRDKGSETRGSETTEQMAAAEWVSGESLALLYGDAQFSAKR